MSAVWSKLSRGIFLLGSVLLLTTCNPAIEQSSPTTHLIEIKEMKFQPESLLVEAGDSIVWVNRDMVAHDVTESKDSKWSSSTLASGASWGLIVKESADYYCSLHQVMKGKLLVE